MNPETKKYGIKFGLFKYYMYFCIVKPIEYIIMGIHVIYYKGEWKVKKEGAPRALRVFSTRRSAIQYGRELRRRENSNLYVHKPDGTISANESYVVDGATVAV